MDDDVYIHAAATAVIVEAAQAIANVVFEEYTRAGLKLQLHAKKDVCGIHAPG